MSPIYSQIQYLGVKRKRQIIAFCYHAGIIAISMSGIKLSILINSPELRQVSSIVLLLHLLTFKVIPISRWIQERLIPEASCPGCGAVIELVGLHRCGCGFISHVERHIFSDCQMCGKSFLWIVCPECDISIRI